MKTYKHILLPVDFSADSENATQIAIDSFGDTAEKITILTVSETMAQRHVMSEVDGILYEAAVNQLKIFKEKFQPLCNKIDTIIKKGNPAVQIIKVAHELNIDLIVMGSQGRNALARVFFGGTTYQVARKSPCSVLVVRAEQAD